MTIPEVYVFPDDECDRCCAKGVRVAYIERLTGESISLCAACLEDAARAIKEAKRGDHAQVQ